MSPALQGVRVIDLTQVMAGPFCTMMLGDMGADVIKIEPPGTGDLTRRMGGDQLALRGEDRAPFLALNRNKRSVELDLREPEGRDAFFALVRTADVVVESFRPGVVQRLGIEHAAVANVEPRIVYASISGFGQTGPLADRPGFDLIAQGLAGIMSVTGSPGGPPVKCGIPIADLSAGLHALAGILAALVARERTGVGQYIETSLFESALGLSVWEATELWATGDAPAALGSAHRLSAPYQAFRTGDGYITLAALTRAQWEGLCEVIGRRDLTDDARFATNADRMANRAELVAEMEAALAAFPSAKWVERFVAAGVPCGPIQSLDRVFEDAHTIDRRMVEEIEHPVEGRIRTLGFPLKMHGTPASIRRPPPLLGEHTDEILREVGMTRASGTRPDREPAR